MLSNCQVLGLIRAPLYLREYLKTVQQILNSSEKISTVFALIDACIRRVKSPNLENKLCVV